MNWFAYLNSIPELSGRVYHPAHPQKQPTALYLVATYGKPGAGARGVVGGATGTQTVDLELILPRQLNATTGGDETNTATLKSVANRIWLELPLKVTQDLIDNVAEVGTFRVSQPYLTFDKQAQQHLIAMEMRFRVFAPYVSYT